ncbi:MAG: hypothetical protein ACREEP_18330, partial [Dongiaceae bacterium]
MNQVPARWPVPTFLAAITVAGALALVDHVRFVDLILDSFTGIFAGVGALIVAGRLALGFMSRRERLLWRFALAVFLLIALGEFAEPFSESAERRLGIDNIDDLLLLAVAPVALWFTSKLEPMPILPRRWLIVAFILQIGAMVLDFLDDGQIVGLSLSPARVASYVDFAQFLSMQSYLLAVFWTVVDVRRRAADRSNEAESQVGSFLPHFPTARRSIRDGLYPPPFIFTWSLPRRGRPARRVHSICNGALWPNGDIIGGARNIGLIALWPFIASARAAIVLKMNGDAARRLTGKTKLRQFLEQLHLAVRFRIAPNYYYVYEFYRPGQWKQAPHYLMRYETKEIAYRLLYPVETEQYAPTPLKNKVKFAQYCRINGLRHVPVLMVFDAENRLPDVDFVGHLPEA